MSTMMNFAELLKQLGTTCSISSTSYDTAWVARLNDPFGLGNQALDWICEHQLPDGSWGVDFPFNAYDRILSTLSAIIALTNKGALNQNKLRIQRGLAALGKLTEMGAASLFGVIPVGFEMIAPSLIAEAEQLGIITQRKEHLLGRLAHLQEIKLQKLKGIKISRFITAAHSSEMVGRNKLDLLDIEKLQEKNGSVGSSPSATAHFALYISPNDPTALDYLRSAALARGGGAPALMPTEIFERIWVLWNLSITNIYQSNKEIADLCDTHLDYLEKCWRPGQGLGFSESFSLTDGDDTSVAYTILSNFGRKPDLQALLQYEDQKWFRCFHHETNPSIDVNIHVLGALKQANYEVENPTVQKVLNFIQSTRLEGKYWTDKWHLSPYYTTSHMIICSKGYDIPFCQDSIKWILDTQRADGSWGFYKIATAEETAYCIQALATSGPGYSEEINLAHDWLLKNLESPYPPLWVDKALYCPEILVSSSILSAMVLAENYGL
jgi:halimadienyl-diphosphate synthase